MIQLIGSEHTRRKSPVTNAWCRNIKKTSPRFKDKDIIAHPRGFIGIFEHRRERKACATSRFEPLNTDREPQNALPLGPCPGLVQPRSTKSTSHGGTKVYLQSFIVAALPSVGPGRYRGFDDVSRYFRDSIRYRYFLCNFVIFFKSNGLNF